MVLDQLTYGASRHLTDYDQGTQQLLYILCLPLIDGVFASMLVSGTITTFSDILAVSLTLFSGAGALAVLYSTSDSVESARKSVLKAAPILILGSLLVGLVAPVYAELFNTSLLKYATGLTLLSIAAEMADLKIADRMPPHAVIITGMVLSLQTPASIDLGLSYLPQAGLTSVIALISLYASSSLKKYDLNLKMVRLGGASALSIIAASVLFSVPSELSILVLGISFAASLKY
jgi:hypothetical protein